MERSGLYAGTAGNAEVTFTFDALPDGLEQMRALDEASLDTPFKTAALTVLALCRYPADRDASLEMLDWLRGPRPLSVAEKQFISDRFMDGADYVPRSYFAGATPENDYTPSVPYTLTFYAGPYAYSEENYAALDVRSGGADTPRRIKLRKKADGTWALWEQYVLVGIRAPKSTDPWA